MAGLDRSAESRKRVYDAIERAYEKLGHDCLRLCQLLSNATSGRDIFHIENDALVEMID